MNYKKLSDTLNRMVYAIHYRDQMLSNTNIWQAIEKYEIKCTYNIGLFNIDCTNLKKFKSKGVDLYNRDFIGEGGSICAVAKPLSDKLAFVSKNI